ncbi:MAG: M1 family peptidase, partial [Verrucomicrobia bacterium]|nr:M1 family peptidase [Cytophagales bacterium]
MRKSIFIFIFFLSFFGIFAQKEAKILQGALRPERTCFDAVFYDLHLSIFPDAKAIKGYNAITFKILASTKKIQLDLFSNMTIDSIVFDKKHLSYERQYNAVFINFPDSLPANTLQTLKFYYFGHPRSNIGPHGDTGFHWKKDA